MQKSERVNFGSKIGAVLAAAGSAVGLGNIWRFPYETGNHGGAAFILVYLACVFMLGMPIMIAEFTVGRHSKASTGRAYKVLAPGTHWKWLGYLGVLAGFLILGYYSVVAGWTLEYILEAGMNGFADKKPEDFVGGGDTACEEAVYLAGLAAKVYLIVRKPYLRASKIMQERVMKHDKIEVLFEHNAVGLFGENGVEGVHLVQRMGEPDEKRYDVAIDGFFLAIGHKPNSDIFKPYVDTDEVGYIVTEPGTPRTKVPGVFAAGDVADSHYRQAITAAGTGCQAAIEAERYLSAKGLI